MTKTIRMFFALLISFSFMVFGSLAGAEDKLDTLKDELRTEYKEQLEIYKALEDKSTDSAKEMRLNLVYMADEAKNIRDAMKELKTSGSEDTTELDGFIATFRQYRAEFSKVYTAFLNPVDNTIEETPAEEVVAEEEVQEPVFDDETPMAEEAVTEGVAAEETMDQENVEKIVIAEDTNSAATRDDDFEFDESEFE